MKCLPRSIGVCWVLYAFRKPTLSVVQGDCKQWSVCQLSCCCGVGRGLSLYMAFILSAGSCRFWYNIQQEKKYTIKAKGYMYVYMRFTSHIRTYKHVFYFIFFLLLRLDSYAHSTFHGVRIICTCRKMSTSRSLRGTAGAILICAVRAWYMMLHIVYTEETLARIPYAFCVDTTSFTYILWKRKMMVSGGIFAVCVLYHRSLCFHWIKDGHVGT